MGQRSAKLVYICAAVLVLALIATAPRLASVVDPVSHQGATP